MLQDKNSPRYIFGLIIFLGLILGGCDMFSDDGNQARLSLQFQTTSSSDAGSDANLRKPKADEPLTIEGSNGTLVIDDIRFIVEDFELERPDEECENLPEAQEEECEEFEFEPFFIDLPLQSDSINLGSSPIEPGLYEELEFEVDDLDLDEEPDEDEQSKRELAQIIRSVFPDWPNEVSMFVLGSFSDNDGNSTDFKAFAEADIEIELEFNPPLEVGENTINKIVRVNIDPASWFIRSDGTVLDLSQYDFDSTGKILEFENEIENGFESIEIDEDDNGDDES